jgi:hypothetical protein
MKKTPQGQAGGPEHPDSNRKALTLRVVRKCEEALFRELSGKFHYMGEGTAAGDTLRLAVEEDGRWVALLLWGAAAYRLKHRDAHIGWDPALRARRQKLVVQNRRFVLLSPPGSRPNLASQVLGLAVRELPALWRGRFGYEPLLAESFCDIEARAGTCYKAAGWTPLGLTKGYSRHRADFYVPNDRPKKLWVKELRPGAAALLRAAELPPECLQGAASDADGVLPLGLAGVESLHATLCKVPDPRARNSSFHIGGMLSVVAMALLCGHRDLSGIVRFANRLHHNHRVALGLPRFARGGTYRKVPGYTALRNLLRQLDPDGFAAALGAWLAAHSGTLPKSLALDGKFIRETVGVVCLAEHATGVPVAMGVASQKEGEGARCELKVGQRLLREADLTHAVVTADPLHCQRETARAIVAGGGEYLFQAKGNQKGVRERAGLKTDALPPLLP